MLYGRILEGRDLGEEGYMKVSSSLRKCPVLAED